MDGQVVAYARTSTGDQIAGLEAQLRDLKKAGASKIFSEQVSSVADRPQLEAMLDYVREGDVVVVTKLDRLARSMPDLMRIVGRLKEKKASLRILAMNLDTSTPTGALMLGVLGSVAQFEREMMLERQREGIAKAKTQGKYKGRAPTAARRKAEIEELLAEGLGPSDICAKLGIGRSSVYRVAEDAIRAKQEKRRALLSGDKRQ